MSPEASRSSRRTRTGLFVVLALILVAAVVFWRSGTTTDAPAPPQAVTVSPKERAPASPRARPAQGEAEVDAEAPSEPVTETHAPAIAEVPKARLRIHGRVIDASNVGVPRAEVELRAWSGTEPNVQWHTVNASADLNGAFEVTIDRDRASIGFGIATTAKGFVEGFRSVTLPDYDESRGVDVAVEAARAIVGRVLDAEARPIPGTTLQLWYGSETTWPTEVDAEGRFRTPPHAPRRAFEIVVQAPGHPSRSVPVAASAEEVTDVGDIVFRGGGRLRGVVVDHHGNPVQDLPLVVKQIDDPKAPPPRAQTDTAGRFEFTDLSLDRVTIHVDEPCQGGPAGARRAYRGGISDVEAGRNDVRIEVRSQTTIWLKFVDADTRKPVDVKKAEYGLRYEGDPEPERLGHGASGSDPLTSTVLSAASGRRYDLTVRSPGFEDARVNGIDVGEVTEMTIDVPMRRKR